MSDQFISSQEPHPPILIQILLEEIYSCDMTASIGSEKTAAAAEFLDHVRATSAR